MHPKHATTTIYTPPFAAHVFAQAKAAGAGVGLSELVACALWQALQREVPFDVATYRAAKARFDLAQPTPAPAPAVVVIPHEEESL